MALIAEDYAFPYSQVQGFMTEYCKVGGKVPHKAWVPLGEQGLLLGHRQDAAGRRRAAGGAGRRRRGELPHPVRAGGRQQADGRRLDHGRPDGAQLQGQAARIAARHAVGRPDRRQLRQRRVEEVRRRLQGELQGRLPSPSLFAYVYYINTKARARRARRREGRPVGQPGEVPRGADEPEAQDADRRGHARREPPGHRHRPSSPRWPRAPTAASTTRS